MFENMTLFEMISKGGITVFILIGISILSWWIIIERSIKFYKIKIDSKDFSEKMKKLLKKRDYDGAITLAQTTPGPIGAVILEGLKNRGEKREKIENAMQRVLNFEVLRMQRYLGVLGSIGNISPFIGLFGTVLGIINAFRALSLSSGAGPSVVAEGISEALVATAAGLFVAVPAVISYNFFVRAIDNIETEVINISSEIVDIISEE